MFVLEVIPLSRGVPADALSYRHATRAPRGTLVSVPLRRKQVLGIVLECHPVAEAKAQLKRASYALRRGAVAVSGQLADAYLDIARELARLYAAPEGSVLHALIGPFAAHAALPLSSGSGSEEERIEAAYADRLAAYERMVARATRAKRSVLIVAPTAVEVARVAKHFSNHRPVVLTGETAPKAREAAIHAAHGAALIVATPAFALAPIENLEALILERAGAGSYRMEAGPRLDVREAARAFARARGTTLVWGDLPLPLSLVARGGSPLPARNLGAVSLIDVRRDSDEPRAPFRALSPEASLRIKDVLAAGGRVALLATRKGYAPQIVCRDCGTPVTDENGRALSFAKTGGAPVFRSADGRTLRAADVHCKTCGSWNLLPLGIGIERVMEEVALAFPGAKTLALAPETLRSKARTASAMASMQEPGIVMGTESMLPYLDPGTPFDEAIIVSADSLLALPFWSSRERLVRIGIALRERAKHLTIQTRNPNDAALSAIIGRGDTDFWREEDALRARYLYPPYGRLLLLRSDQPMGSASRTASLMMEALGGTNAVRLPDRLMGPKTMRVSMLARFKASAWPANEVLSRLRLLSPSVLRLVDPDSLW